MQFKRYISLVCFLGELTLACYYFLLGVYHTVISGPFYWVVLFRFPFLNHWYFPALAGSLVVFGAYGFFLLYEFGARAGLVFLLTYSIFELVGGWYFVPFLPPYGITVILGAVGLTSYLLVRHHLRLNWFAPCAWIFLWMFFVVALLSKFPGVNLEFSYEATLIPFVIAFFRPRSHSAKPSAENGC